MKKKTYVGWTFENWTKLVGWTWEFDGCPGWLLTDRLYRTQKGFHKHHPEEKARKMKVTFEEL